MTNLVQIFGTHLRPMMEFVTRMRTEGPLPPFDFEQLYQAHDILSQEMDTGWFVRGEEPPKMLNGHSQYFEMKWNPEWDKWKHYQSMFKGEWEIKDKYYRDKSWIEVLLLNGEYVDEWRDAQILDKFAQHCLEQEIPLELNEEYYLENILS